MTRLTPRVLAGFAFALFIFSLSCASWEPRNEVFPLRGGYNNQFYKRHPQNFKLTTVAHWAHGSIADILIEAPPDPAQADRMFYERARWHLDHPPETEPHQEYVSPRLARRAWRAIQVIDWTHQLHEQLYDILADPTIAAADKKRWIDRSVDFYLAEPAMAFSPAPFEEVIMNRVKPMAQPWFGAFRKDYQRASSLFKAFHWWHPAVYEAQLLYPGAEEQKRAILQVDGLFGNQVLAEFPKRMLLSREVMPRFSRLAPEAANIFDNLHMFHGVVYDILASPNITDKRAEIYRNIDLMLARPGDRNLAADFPTPQAEVDPLVYSEAMKGEAGEMARIMGHGHHGH